MRWSPRLLHKRFAQWSDNVSLLSKCFPRIVLIPFSYSRRCARFDAHEQDITHAQNYHMPHPYYDLHNTLVNNGNACDWDF